MNKIGLIGLTCTSELAEKCNCIHPMAPKITVDDEDFCWGCGKCVEICEYGAPQLEIVENSRQISVINAVLCKGCGVCVAVCPSGALSAQDFTRDQVLSMIEKFGGD